MQAHDDALSYLYYDIQCRPWVSVDCGTKEKY